MKAPFAVQKYLSIVLSAIALLLCGILYWEWESGVQLERDLSKLRKIPVTPVVIQGALPEFVLPDVTLGFPEMVSRSLFSVSRRSSGGARKDGPSTMKKGQFVLVGVLVTPARRAALLRDVQTNKTEAVPAGGVVRGMTLGEVEAGRVVMRQGTEVEELILNVQSGPKGAPAGIGAAPPVQPAPPVGMAAPTKGPASATPTPPGAAPVASAVAPPIPTPPGPRGK